MSRATSGLAEIISKRVTWKTQTSRDGGRSAEPWLSQHQAKNHRERRPVTTGSCQCSPTHVLGWREDGTCESGELQGLCCRSGGLLILTSQIKHPTPSNVSALRSLRNVRPRERNIPVLQLLSQLVALQKPHTNSAKPLTAILMPAFAGGP